MKKLFPLLIAAILLLCSACSSGTTQIEASSTQSNSDSKTGPEATQIETSTTTVENSNTREIMYNKVPVAQLYNCDTIDDIAEIMGKPLSEEHFGAGSDYSYGDIRLFFDNYMGGLYSITCDNPEAFEINGTTLDTNRAGLIEIFGNPSKEGWNEWNEELYEIIYSFESYDISFAFDASDGKVDYFTFMAITDDGNGDSTYSEAKGDFNRSINYDELEIVINDNHEVARHNAVGYIQSDYLFLFPQITNIGSNPTTLNQYDVSVFGPNGSEITPLQDIFDNNVFYNPLSQGRGNIMPGASQTLMIVIPYQGSGDYTVFFSGLVSQESLSLPISRDTALSSRGIVGVWSLDSTSSNGYYTGIGTENIEFLEDGNGYITINGTANTFTWYILLTDQNSRLAVQTQDNTIIYSDALIYPSSLLFSNISTYRLWTHAGIIRDEHKQHEGTDEFIRN